MPWGKIANFQAVSDGLAVCRYMVTRVPLLWASLLTIAECEAETSLANSE